MKYYFISGERSGDLHASNLAKELKKNDSQATLRGTGGDYLKATGAEIFRHYKDIAFMGLWEVFMNLRAISRIFKEVQSDILSFQPDVLILVDFGGFNMRMAKWAKEKNIKVFYYISPKIWAWNQKRALKIKATVDRMFVIMPFEKEFYEKFGYTKVDYIGNPVQDAVGAHVVNQNFRTLNNLSDKPIIAILAGSRKQEVTVMLKTMLSFTNEYPDYHFVIAGVSNLPKEYYEPYRTDNISIVYDQAYDVLAFAEAAVVTSGTATLETALFEVPQVVCYKTNPITYFIGKPLVKIKFFSLPNLIAGREIVKELLQHEFTSDVVSQELKKLLGKEYRQKMKEEYARMKHVMGEKGASGKAAKLMVNYLIREK
ncbi:MAG TPA: lipid-A-disaccharide synthase [Cytophagaceae bacterium]|jgi:lipid-A-disaccharide synthase|nr:lipid-A-disaccharide synthase [Cytophagaceae bacterium]